MLLCMVYLPVIFLLGSNWLINLVREMKKNKFKVGDMVRTDPYRERTALIDEADKSTHKNPKILILLESKRQENTALYKDRDYGRFTTYWKCFNVKTQATFWFKESSLLPYP
jgi:hypothetical protein